MSVCICMYICLYVSMCVCVLRIGKPARTCAAMRLRWYAVEQTNDNKHRSVYVRCDRRHFTQEVNKGRSREQCSLTGSHVYTVGCMNNVNMSVINRVGWNTLIIECVVHVTWLYRSHSYTVASNTIKSYCLSVCPDVVITSRPHYDRYQVVSFGKCLQI